MKPLPAYHEATVRITEDSLRHLTEQPYIGACFVQDNVFTYVNHEFSGIFGYQQSELLGVRNLLDLVAKHDHAKVRDYFSHCEHGATQDLPLFFQGLKANADVVDLEAHGILIELNGKSSIIGTLAVVTKQTKAVEQLQQAQKMEAISQLAGGLAHDFNNLLTVINGYSTMLLRSLEQESPLHKIVENILNAGERAVEMTRQLHSFSNRQILAPELINIDNKVKCFESLLSRIVGSQLHVITDLRSHDSVIQIDPAQLEEIITNLITNARDASEAGSSIILKTADHTLDDALLLTHPDLAPGDYVILSVTNFGMDLDDYDKKRIFEPFYRSKTMKRGTGLGLAVVYGIVKQNNGTIDVISQPEQGTTFRVIFPKRTN
jgi:PAS domain S-box-containing protein